MPEENVEVVRSMLGAFNRDDVDAVIAAFDEGCEIREPLEMPDSPAMGYRGHDAPVGGRDWLIGALLRDPIGRPLRIGR